MSSLKQSAYRVIYIDMARRERRIMVVLKSPVPGGRWESYEEHPAVAVLQDQGYRLKKVLDVKRLRANIIVE